MAVTKANPEDVARVMIRVHLPEIDPARIAALRKEILAAVKEYPGAEVEVTVLPTLPSR